jgi:hypothetical protein
VFFRQWWEMAKLFCMQFVLHADMLFLQRSAILYPVEHFHENGRHFPFNNFNEWAKKFDTSQKLSSSLGKAKNYC